MYPFPRQDDFVRQASHLLAGITTYLHVDEQRVTLYSKLKP